MQIYWLVGRVFICSKPNGRVNWKMDKPQMQCTNHDALSARGEKNLNSFVSNVATLLIGNFMSVTVVLVGYVLKSM